MRRNISHELRSEIASKYISCAKTRCLMLLGIRITNVFSLLEISLFSDHLYKTLSERTTAGAVGEEIHSRIENIQNETGTSQNTGQGGR